MESYGCLKYWKKDGTTRIMNLNSCCTIGRSLEATIRLKATNPHVEDIHCMIEMKNESVVLTNKAATNPVTVNGRKISFRKILTNGDVIEVLDKKFTYESSSDHMSTGLSKIPLGLSQSLISTKSKIPLPSRLCKTGKKVMYRAVGCKSPLKNSTQSDIRKTRLSAGNVPKTPTPAQKRPVRSLFNVCSSTPNVSTPVSTISNRSSKRKSLEVMSPMKSSGKELEEDRENLQDDLGVKEMSVANADLDCEQSKNDIHEENYSDLSESTFADAALEDISSIEESQVSIASISSGRSTACTSFVYHKNDDQSSQTVDVKEFKKQTISDQDVPQNDSTDVASIEYSPQPSKMMENTDGNTESAEDIIGSECIILNTTDDEVDEIDEADGTMVGVENVTENKDTEDDDDINNETFEFNDNKESVDASKVQKTPKSDLTNIEGIAYLLQTPKVEENIDGNVVGIEAYLLQTPKVDDHDGNVVGVEDIIKTTSNVNDEAGNARSTRMTSKAQETPNNDLADAKGVMRYLLRTPKTTKSSNNDICVTPGANEVFENKELSSKPSDDVIKYKSDHDKNDQSFNLKGAKRLLRTPKVQKAPNNDLSDVDGVEGLLQTPKTVTKNSDSSVLAVEKLIESEEGRSNRAVKRHEKNVSFDFKGVKRLLRTPKVQKWPENDLTDVEGVENLMQTPMIVENNDNDTLGVEDPIEIDETASNTNVSVDESINNEFVDFNIAEECEVSQITPKNDRSDVGSVRYSLRTPKTLATNDSAVEITAGNKQDTPKSNIAAKRQSNDESFDFKGVKRLLHKPKVQIAPKDDLTDVEGVGNFMQTPNVIKNDRNETVVVEDAIESHQITLKSKSKVRKQANNESFDFKGVKRLLRTPKVQKGPKNDLTDVEGVHNLMQTPMIVENNDNDTPGVEDPIEINETASNMNVSVDENINDKLVDFNNAEECKVSQITPKNDRSDVGGVRYSLRTPKTIVTNDNAVVIADENKQGTPESQIEAKKQSNNESFDFKGVKRLLRTPKVQKGPKNDLTDVEGVQNLMQTPNVVKVSKNTNNDLIADGNTIDSERNISKINDRTVERRINESFDFDGVDRLLHTPRVQKAPKNDLTDVEGVGYLLRTPKTSKISNDDSCVEAGDKEMFENVEGASNVNDVVDEKKSNESFDYVDIINKTINDSSADDCINESIQTLKETNEQHFNGVLSDLTNVGVGVKDLSGVQKGQVQNSPKNDLGDVYGVKRMFAQEEAQLRSMSPEISGVEYLFKENSSSNASAFDLLTNTRPIKTYTNRCLSPVVAAPSYDVSGISETSFVNKTYTENWLNEQVNLSVPKIHNSTPLKSNNVGALSKCFTVDENQSTRKGRKRKAKAKKSLDDQNSRMDESPKIQTRVLRMRKKSNDHESKMSDDKASVRDESKKVSKTRAIKKQNKPTPKDDEVVEKLVSPPEEKPVRKTRTRTKNKLQPAEQDDKIQTKTTEGLPSDDLGENSESIVTKIKKTRGTKKQIEESTTSDQINVRVTRNRVKKLVTESDVLTIKPSKKTLNMKQTVNNENVSDLMTSEQDIDEVVLDKPKRAIARKKELSVDEAVDEPELNPLMIKKTRRGRYQKDVEIKQVSNDPEPTKRTLRKRKGSNKDVSDGTKSQQDADDEPAPKRAARKNKKKLLVDLENNEQATGELEINQPKIRSRKISVDLDINNQKVLDDSIILINDDEEEQHIKSKTKTDIKKTDNIVTRRTRRNQKIKPDNESIDVENDSEQADTKKEGDDKSNTTVKTRRQIKRSLENKLESKQPKKVHFDEDHNISMQNGQKPKKILPVRSATKSRRR